MFTMDLLKGQGVPMKNRPWGVAIVAMVFAVPILVAFTMLGFYLSNRIVIRVTQQEITNYEKQIESLSDAIEKQKTLEAEKESINKCLLEALASLSKHTQWSPILATIVENMPDSVILTKLEARQRFVRRTVPKEDNPKKTVEVTVPESTLHMSVSGSLQADTDKAIRDFKDRLRLSDLLASRLKDIRISQKSDSFEGQEVVSYQIDCVFGPEI